MVYSETRNENRAGVRMRLNQKQRQRNMKCKNDHRPTVVPYQITIWSKNSSKKEAQPKLGQYRRRLKQ